MSIEISKFFDEAFLGSGGGTPVATCSCGRTTYCDSDHYEEGEREDLDSSRNADPQRMLYIEDDYVSIYVLWDITFVFGCPCGGLKNLENQIWHHRAQIAKYLAIRARANVADANAVLDSLALTESPQ